MGIRRYGAGITTAAKQSITQKLAQSGVSSGTVVFPVSFKEAPAVLVATETASGLERIIVVFNVTATGFQWQSENSAGSATLSTGHSLVYTATEV